MRILHTSDWHLGRSFHGESLLAEQRQAVDRLVEMTSDRNIDLVVIAGDLYDRAIPPTDAVRLFDDALVALHEADASVVAITGNHDSPSRVAVADRVLEQAGVAVRGDVSRCAEPLRFEPDDGGPPVHIYPVPYLEPSLAGPELDRLDVTTGDADHQESRRASHDKVTDQATALIRRHASAAGPLRTVVVAHTFVAGGTETDSERALSLGSIDRVGLSAFDGFDYVALGHLHRSQDFDNGRIAYSGSPLPYSFSEEGSTKSVRIVEMDAAGRCSTEAVPLGVGRPLRTLTGRFADLLENPELADTEAARVRVRLTDDELPLQAMARLQKRFPHAVVLEHMPDGRLAPGGTDIANAVASAETASELTLRFWSDQHGRDATQPEREVLASAVAAAAVSDERR
ncbi:MAG: exonuclease SbcCD subunit D [Acidimicrobiaceae bacterium]|nr:exonuclease SbcCD subunit D [Acidimicrobiaceae bacterium]